MRTRIFKKNIRIIHRGFATLVSVLAVSAVGSVIAVSVLLLGISSQNTSFAIEQSSLAKSYAVACAEDALQEIRESTPFTGTGSISFAQGACTYTVTSQGGQARTITASAEVGMVIRKVKVIIDSINPTIDVVSWQEIPDF